MTGLGTEAALELAIVELAPSDMIDRLAVVTGLLEALIELPADSAPAFTLGPATADRARVIYLRELLSNASDAIDELCFEQLMQASSTRITPIAGKLLAILSDRSKADPRLYAVRQVLARTRGSGESSADAHRVASDVIAGGLRALASGLSRSLRWRSPCDVSKLC